MAKRKNKNRGATYAPQARRGLIETATRTPLRVSSPSVLQLVEDRRTIPHDIRPFRYVDTAGVQAQVVKRPVDAPARSVRAVPPPLFHKFVHPERVPVCIRRQTRRRVLFALRHAGRGKSLPPRRWTAKSFIRCK